MSPRGRLLLGAWAPPAAWCAIVFAVSALPVRVQDERLQGADKAVHLVEYAVLGALLARAILLGNPGRAARSAVLLAAGIAAGWGVTDEVHQLFVPERAFEWADLAADAAGGLLGATAYALLTSRRTSGSPAPRPSGPPGP